MKAEGYSAFPTKNEPLLRLIFPLHQKDRYIVVIVL